MSDHIIIFDTSLRDGEQSPGATMTIPEKVKIAGMLDDMGVDVIEAGFAAASKGDTECIDQVARSVENATVCSLARGIISDIDAAAKALENAAKPRIHTFISTSDIHIEHQFKMTRAQVLEVIAKTVSHAKSFCEDVEWSAMDATRSDLDYLTEAVGIAIESGAGTVNIPDTVGYTQPQEYFDVMAHLSKKFPETIFSAHCHNDLGLATANTLAAIRGGARQVECTINGIGERAGNTAMEEVVMALKTRPNFYGIDSKIDTKKIYAISRRVSAITGFAVQKNKAIVGANAFAHESGIHQDGMLKNRNTYEIITPESVGVEQTSLVLGKHSGRAALKSKMHEWGIVLEDDGIAKVFEEFKALCDSKKHVTETDIFDSIFARYSNQTSSLAKLTGFEIKRGKGAAHDAKVTVEFEGQEIELSATSVSPMRAVMSAMGQLLDQKNIDAKMIDFDTSTVSHGGDDAPSAEAKLTLEYKGESYGGHARGHDLITTALNAYMSAINKIFIHNSFSNEDQNVANSL